MNCGLLKIWRFGFGNPFQLDWDLIFINMFNVYNLITVTACHRTFPNKTVNGEG